MVLITVTCLALLEGRLGIIPYNRGTGITITGWDEFIPHAVVEKECLLPASDLTQLVIDAEAARVTVSGAETDSIQILATVHAAASTVEKVEEDLAGFKIDAIVEGETAILRAKMPSEMPKIGTFRIVYQVTVPQDLFISAVVQQGLLELSDLSGGIDLDAEYSGSSANNLSGGIAGDIRYGSIELKRVEGPVDLQTVSSAVELVLVDVPAGYTFDIEAAYGTIDSTIGLERKEDNALITAKGVLREGEYPVTVRSRFSTVEISLER